MKIGIIGGGISGVFAAIRIKENNPNHEVYIFEHNNKLLKKIYVSGNGKCNFANLSPINDQYNNVEFVKPILDEFSANDIISYFNKIGVSHKAVGNLVYPYSETALTVINALSKRVIDLGINVCLDTEVIDYVKTKDKYLLKTSQNEIEFDALVFSSGGVASKGLGSDNSILSMLIKHDYRISRLSPTLCPIKTEENTKFVSGLRNNVNVRLYKNNKLIHQEDGELLFKDDGLSGIVIFNMTHYINKDLFSKYELLIDFLPDKNEKINKNEYSSYFHPKLAEYFIKHNINDVKNVKFTFKKLYDFEFAHVSSGGISLDQLDGLMSKKEKNLYFIGEILDINGICGGYNIMWALASANKVSKLIR